MATFWLNDGVRTQISMLGLVASDAAYKNNGFGENSLLRSNPDHAIAAEDYPLHETIVRRAADALDPGSRLAFSPTDFLAPSGNEIAGVEFTNWRQFRNVIEDPDTGAAAVIYRRLYTAEGVEKAEYLLAFRGTDGRNGQDWFTNIQLGKNQWRGLSTRLFDPEGPIATLNSPDGSIPVIHFTGQSLGGGLAQYAAYEYVRQRESDEALLFDPSFFAERSNLVTLTTFNEFAG
jgi:hypothetical protein